MENCTRGHFGEGMRSHIWECGQYCTAVHTSTQKIYTLKSISKARRLSRCPCVEHLFVARLSMCRKRGFVLLRWIRSCIGA